MSREVSIVMKNKQKAFMKYKMTGIESDSYRCRSKQRLVKKITRQAETGYERDMARNIKLNIKTLFKYISL